MRGYLRRLGSASGYTPKPPPFAFLQFCIIHIADSLLISGLNYRLVLDGGEITYDRVQAEEQSNN